MEEVYQRRLCGDTGCSAVVRSLFIVDFDILRQEGGVFTELDSQSGLLSLV